MTQSSSCDEIGDGALTANVTGGTAPYTYEWSSEETTAAISDKSIGEYTVTVTDANNCEAVVASESITTNDLTPPVASVQDIDVYLDHTGAASIVAPDVDGGSTDDCFISDYSIDVSEFSCADVGATPSFDGNTVIAFDGEDDYLEFDQVIPYSANHTFAFWIKTEPGSGGTAFTWGSPTVNNSTGLRIWSDRIRYSSVDGPGQTQTVNTSSFLGDNEWHHVVAVRNGNDVQIFVDGQLNVSGQITNQISNPTSTSLGGGLINGIYQSFMNGQLDEFAYWPQALSQQEAEGLMCAGIQGAEVYLDFESGSGTTAVTDVSGNGNSASLNNMDATTDWVAFGDAKPLTSCPAGVKVRLSVTDAGGNQAHADAYVTVRDTVSPVASARSHSLELDTNGEVTAVAEDFDDGSTDNCEIESFSLNKSAFSCEDLGSNDIILTVTDIHGNSKSVGTQVEVVDNLAPTVELQNIEVSLDENGEASIAADDLEVSAADNCAVASKNININSFSCEDLGEEIEVTYIAADASGNETELTATVTVVEEIAPIAV
ncbi:MAG: LamG-like jellyroll fold domain-containing protein, partial [Cryomorphaceae bacterium]